MTGLACGWGLALWVGAASATLAATPADAGVAASFQPAEGAIPYTLATRPGRLLLRDATGRVLRDWPVQDAQGARGEVLAAFDAPRRRSFVVALSGLPELWEISVDPAAEPIFDGLVHDYRMGEGLARPGFLGLRRSRLERPWVAAFFDPRVPWLVGAEAPDAPGGAATAVVLHLDIRRAVARLPLPASAASPLAGTALWWEAGSGGARWQLALPAPEGWAVYDTARWTLLRQAAGPR
ncbi:MAG: hypothetical protein Q7U26_00190 [Aquabacterium sp.]|nr:hypothetical protein [Aquabacterium sp.]